MKKLLTVAIAMVLAGSAGAATLHQDASNKVDLGGRIEARFNTHDHDVSRARLNVTLEHKVNDKVSVIGFAESEANHKDGVFAKDVYAGFKHNGNTLVTYGHQNSADDFVTDFTDVLSYSGADANLRLAGGDNTLRILNTTGDTTSSFSMTSNESFTASWLNAGKPLEASTYVGAMKHSFGDVSVGGAYSRVNFTSHTYDKADMYQLGGAYDGEVFYAGVLGSYMHTSTSIGDSVDAKGVEVAGKYHVLPQVDLITAYNYRHADVNSKVGMDVTNYYTVGAEYKFDKNVKVYGEYKNDLTSTGDNSFTAAIKYKF